MLKNLYSEACSKFISLCQRRPDLINHWKPGVDDRAVRSSSGSDMSIEDPTDDSSGSHQRPHSQTYLDQSRLSTCQQPKPLTTSSPTIRNVNGKNEVREATKEPSEKEKKEEAQTESSSSTPAGPQHTRRLSVQDRINLFENKQKEQSSSGSGGKPVVGKSVELRRLSSDVSSAPVGVEKAVLRRWSGTSDMSIDLSAEKKDTESPLSTPSSASSISQAKSNNLALGGSEGKDQKRLNDSSSSSKAESRSGSIRVGDGGLKDQGGGQTQVVVSSGKEVESESKPWNNWKDQAVSQTQTKFSTLRAEQLVNDQKISLEKIKNSLNTEDRSGVFKDQAGFATQSGGISDKVDITGVRNQAGIRAQTGSLVSKAGDVSLDGRFVNKVEDSEIVDQPVIQSRSKNFLSHSRSQSGQFEFGGQKPKEASSTQPKWVESDTIPSQPQWRSLAGGVEGSEVDLTSSVKQQFKPEDSGVQKMKFQKLVSSSHEQIKKSQVRRDESSLANEDSKLDFKVKKVPANQESSATTAKLPVEQVQRVRQTKGNQELNDELKMKANELEKLFAEHKLRVPGDQSSSAKRNKPVDVMVEGGVSSQYRKLAPEDSSPSRLPEKSMVMESSSGSNNVENFKTPPPTKLVDNQDSGDTLRQNFSELSFSDDSRGKFYERYMQKRNDKLKEEWGSKRAEKEAKLKAMLESLEQSRAELKARFSRSANIQDSVSTARRRAEKLRSFNLSSSIKREQVFLTPIFYKEN